MKLFPDADRPAMSRTTLARDIVVLQAKLLVDGLRDLILVPTSLILRIVSLVAYNDKQPGAEFYRLLHAGKQSEHWINLFWCAKECTARSGRDQRIPRRGHG